MANSIFSKGFSIIKWQNSHKTLTLHIVWTRVVTLFSILFLAQLSNRYTVDNSVCLRWLVVLDTVIKRGMSMIGYHSNNASKIKIIGEDCDWHKDILLWLNMNMLNVSNIIPQLGLSLRNMAAIGSKGCGGLVGVVWWDDGLGGGEGCPCHSHSSKISRYLVGGDHTS